MECVFCKIVHEKIPSYNIYDDADFLAFLDIYPHALGHTVIIPKTHLELIEELDEEKSQRLMLVIKKVMQRITEVLHPDGFNVGWNNGKAAGQVVPHLHLHIFPRYNGDGGGSLHFIIKNPGSMSVEDVASLFSK